MTLLTPELGQFTITNPVVYSEFDSDLDNQSLSFARRRMAERWDNENILDLTNIFEGKSVFVNMADILTPLAHDEIQKLAMADMPEEQRAEQWSQIHFPDLAYKTILIDNAHPEALVEQFKLGDEKLEAAGGNDLYKEIVDRIARVGIIVSPEQVKQALLVRYIKDSAALENVEAKYGIGGKFLSSIGNFYISQMTDPITALGDLFAFEMGGGVAESISKRYAIKGLGSKALRVVGEAAALGAKHVAIISGITNSRRADVGLPPISTAEAFAWDVFAGITLGAAFSGIFTDGAALLRNKITAYAEKTLARRAVEVAQDAGGRYKHSTETDAELLARARDAVFSNDPVAKDKFKLDVTFPRISDPSIPEINRAFNNSIGSVMNGTEFSTDITGFFSTRLSGWIGSMTPPELLLLSEGLAKAKEYGKFYTDFIGKIKLSDSKETFVNDLRKLIVSDNEAVEYIQSKKTVIHNSGETARNIMGYEALYSNIETILRGAEEEALSARTFTSVRPDLSPENPYQSAVSETDIKLASDWERIKAETEGVIGKREKFKPADFLLSSIESLNSYSANINALRAEFANKFAAEMSGIGSEELLSAWGGAPSGRGSKIKIIVNALKKRLRDVAKEYGITYGEVEDHVPQKWAQEKVSAAGFEKFRSDFLAELDIEKTRKAYNAGLQELFDAANAELEVLKKRVETGRALKGKKGMVLIRKAEAKVADLAGKLRAPFGEMQMRQIYDNIVTDNLLDPSTHTPRPTLKGSQRIMYFKDMRAFEGLNRKYGVMPDFRVLVTRDVDSMIRDISRLRAFSGSEEFFTENVESSLKILLGDRQLGFAERQLKNILDANINYVGGKFGRETTMANAWGRLYMSLIRNSALGGSGLTTFFDDAHSVAFAGSQNGFGFLRTIGEYIKGITKANLTTEEASRLLVALDEVSRGFDEEVYRYPTQSKVADISNLAQKIDNFTFKVNGVNYLTDRGRVTFNKLFLQELGAINAEKNPKMIETLSKYGINEKDFARIAEVPLDIDGIPLFNEEFKKTKTYEKILRALYSESRKAIASTSQSLKAVMASEGYGGRALGIMNSLFFLKRIPMQVFFDKTLMPIYRGEYGEVAKFFAQNIIFTTARLTLKYLTMGYVPNFADPRFYREVLLQNAAMLPFLQPLFSMDRVDRFNVENALGSTFLGAYAPIVDIAKLVTRDAFTDVGETQIAKDVHRVIKDFAPLKSHPALGLMYERFIFDNIILSMDPEAYRTLAKAEQARTQAGKLKVF